MPETLTDPNIVMGATREIPRNTHDLITQQEGNEPVEAANFKTIDHVWGVTQARIDGEDGQDIDGNKAVPSLYQEVIWNQFNGNDVVAQRMLVMNAGHIEPYTRKKDQYDHDATDAVENPLYEVRMKLPVALSDGSIGYMIIPADIAYNDFHRPLDEFMRVEVSAKCAQKLRQHFDLLAKQAANEQPIRFSTTPEKDGRYQPAQFSGFSFLPLGPDKTKEWSGIAKPARQLFEAAVDRNVAAKKEALAAREAKRLADESAAKEAEAIRAQELAAREAIRVAEEAAVNEAAELKARQATLSEDDL